MDDISRWGHIENAHLSRVAGNGLEMPPQIVPGPAGGTYEGMTLRDVLHRLSVQNNGGVIDRENIQVAARCRAQTNGPTVQPWAGLPSLGDLVSTPDSRRTRAQTAMVTARGPTVRDLLEKNGDSTSVRDDGGVPPSTTKHVGDCQPLPRSRAASLSELLKMKNVEAPSVGELAMRSLGLSAQNGAGNTGGDPIEPRRAGGVDQRTISTLGAANAKLETIRTAVRKTESLKGLKPASRPESPDDYSPAVSLPLSRRSTPTGSPPVGSARDTPFGR